MKKITDYIVGSILGTILGIIFVIIVGKLWIVPEWTIIDILKFIVKVHTGWSW